MTSIAAMIVAIDDHLARAGLAHAFGGALALAWCTRAPRGTSDIDLNVFAGVDQVPRVLGALPGPVTWRPEDEQLLERDGQARLHWGSTPIDLFLNTTEFHEGVSERVVFHDFAGALVPFLSCADLAVFKAFFNRTRDWADLEEMIAAGMIDIDRAIGALSRHLGSDDERIRRLVDLAG